MGWYHGKQMLEGMCPSAKLTTIVEPYFLGPGADSPPGKTFNAWAEEMSAKYGTKFAKSVEELELTVCRLSCAWDTPSCSAHLSLQPEHRPLAAAGADAGADLRPHGRQPAAAQGGARRPVCLQGSRTAPHVAPPQIPPLQPPLPAAQLIDHGVTHIFLEKPGAPSVAELQEMQAYAKSKGVPVYMGYNKNVTPCAAATSYATQGSSDPSSLPKRCASGAARAASGSPHPATLIRYVKKALEFEQKTPGASTTFVHNNAYKARRRLPLAPTARRTRLACALRSPRRPPAPGRALRSSALPPVPPRIDRGAGRVLRAQRRGHAQEHGHP